MSFLDSAKTANWNGNKHQKNSDAKICKVFVFHGHLPFRPGDIADAGLWSGCSTLHTSETQKSHAVDFKLPRPFIYRLKVMESWISLLQAFSSASRWLSAKQRWGMRAANSLCSPRRTMATTWRGCHLCTFAAIVLLCPVGAVSQDRSGPTLSVGPRVTTIQWPTGMICYDMPLYSVICFPLSVCSVSFRCLSAPGYISTFTLDHHSYLVWLSSVKISGVKGSAWLHALRLSND